jgi:hypothetical protein
VDGRSKIANETTEKGVEFVLIDSHETFSSHIAQTAEAG